MTAAPICLAPDIHVCMIDGHRIFLDLKRDKYSAVTFPGDAPGSLTEKLALQSEDLLKAGLLTNEAYAGRSIEGASIEGVDGHIFGLADQRAFRLTGEAAEGVLIGLIDIGDVFVASWKASRELEARRISDIVGPARRRKARAGEHQIDIENVRRLTAIFRRLRMWCSRKYLCLYDSLALGEFLAQRGSIRCGCSPSRRSRSGLIGGCRPSGCC